MLLFPVLIMLLVATEDKKKKNSSVKISGKKLQPDMDKNSQHRRRLMEGSASAEARWPPQAIAVIKWKSSVRAGW